MLLTIDIGNTNITFGVYDKQKVLQYHWRIKTDHGRMPDEYGIIILGLMRHEGLNFKQIEGVAIASVVPPLTGVFVEMVERFVQQKPFLIDSTVKTGVEILYDSPRDVLRQRRVSGRSDCAGDWDCRRSPL
jgi:type III pantothenate kinase